ncbi:MAG TPA: phosphotransferase [Deltaproteobacteria bacterium]|nr:phosphotransferase [Deltaproteobacteria bacterium]
MKAMILAAGLGTRLLPLTEKRPKPLFPILGRPLIDILIRRLESSGFEAVIINTHHLAHMIDEFIKAPACGIPVVTRYEPTILGTGGAIKNVEDFWDDEPFLVINGDIFTNIDLKKVYRFHLSHKHPVTLVLHDFSQFNHVWVNPGDHVVGFGHTKPCPPSHTKTSAHPRKLAFTGIQVLDPQVLSFIPTRTFYSIIDAYCKMIREGSTIKGFIAQDHYWHDIGTIEEYLGATRDALARKALKSTFPGIESDSLVWSRLKGDGSDRTWYRVARGKDSLVVVDHGPPQDDGTCEADAFVAIGRHLHNKGMPVPRIFAYDRASGLVALEDLGDLHLQTIIRRAVETEEVAGHYKAVIDLLIAMGIEGAKGFDPAYTYQTPYYDQELILEKESKYFVEAFLNGYIGRNINFDTLENEFKVLAERALKHPYTGLLHRDFQSRNILVTDGNYYFTDFQGARFGPLQYDLASLLIDPYVELPRGLQLKLLNYYLKRLSDFIAVDAGEFLDAYTYCAINRNLQVLGAFGFLARVKGKKDFEAYIPLAVSSLKARLHSIEQGECPKLSKIIQSI